MLYFEVADDTMVKRLLKRAETSGRVDDNEETIKKRLKTFHDLTRPVIEHYNKQGKVHTVSVDPTAGGKANMSECPRKVQRTCVTSAQHKLKQLFFFCFRYAPKER